jgi:Cu/Ag efflux protein CusF
VILFHKENKMNIFLIATSFIMFSFGCGSSVPNAKPANTPPSPTPLPTASVPKNGDYQGKGIVTKINNQLGTVEIKHEEIKDVMPAMQMEFFVSDKAMLKALNIGDAVNFTLRYNGGQENIVAISKSK